MNAVSNLAVAMVLLTSVVTCAAEEVQWAGLRIANAVGLGAQDLRVEINGKAWPQAGLGRGEVTGLRRIEPGPIRLQFSQHGLGARDVRLAEPGD